MVAKPKKKTTKSTAKKKVALTPFQRSLNSKINEINRKYTGQEAKDRIKKAIIDAGAAGFLPKA